LGAGDVGKGRVVGGWNQWVGKEDAFAGVTRGGGLGVQGGLGGGLQKKVGTVRGGENPWVGKKWAKQKG